MKLTNYWLVHGVIPKLQHQHQWRHLRRTYRWIGVPILNISTKQLLLLNLNSIRSNHQWSKEIAKTLPCSIPHRLWHPREECSQIYDLAHIYCMIQNSSKNARKGVVYRSRSLERHIRSFPVVTKHLEIGIILVRENSDLLKKTSILPSKRTWVDTSLVMRVYILLFVIRLSVTLADCSSSGPILWKCISLNGSVSSELF